MCMIDMIFDYLDIQDLQIMTCVSKLFCFAATLERNYDKFNSAKEIELLQKEQEKKRKKDEIDHMVAECLKGMHKYQQPVLQEPTLQIIKTHSNAE